MKFCSNHSHSRRIPGVRVFVAAAIFTLALAPLPRSQAASQISIWDTKSSMAEKPDIQNRTSWKSVPPDLLLLESDPLKANSDPAYYGREYLFSGDAVVENQFITAVFSRTSGQVIVYSKAVVSDSNAPQTILPERKIAEISPSDMTPPGAAIRSIKILHNDGDQIVVTTDFQGTTGADASAIFSFDKSEIMTIQPMQTLPSIRISSAIEFGVVPDFIGDDLIFAPDAFPDSETISAPSEHAFVGLLEGNDRMLVLTWPEGKQTATLSFGAGTNGTRFIQSLDFQNDGQSLYLAPLAAHSIWHSETLKPGYLEKDIRIQWKPPFPAKWVTQLSEARVNTTFAFRTVKGQIWRGVPGMYNYPVWIDGVDVYYRTSKKIPPKGRSIVYFLEGQNTPATINTPVDILKNTLGRRLSDSILDIPGRKLRSHHRRGGDGVRRACTCGATESIQAIFEARKENTEKETISEELKDMIYFVEKHVERIEEYQTFAAGMLGFLRETSARRPELAPYLSGMQRIVEQIPQEYSVQKENMKSLGHAHMLARQTLELAERKDANNLKTYMELLKAWRAMGGAQDYVLAQCHTVTRDLLQRAGYEAATQENATAVASEIRKRARECLRNPDGYEIWPNY